MLTGLRGRDIHDYPSTLVGSDCDPEDSNVNFNNSRFCLCKVTAGHFAFATEAGDALQNCSVMTLSSVSNVQKSAPNKLDVFKYGLKFCT